MSEWGCLPYGEGEGEMPGWAADRIAGVARACPLAGADGAGVLEHGRHALRAKQVVGVVAAEGCSLEILPKIDGPGDPGGGRVRERLVHMLAVAFDLDVAAGRVAAAGWQGEDLLERLIRLFAGKLHDAVRLGLAHRYVGHADDLAALRGRLDATRQFTALAASPQRLACRYDELSPDIALNQLMKAAVTRLRGLARGPDTRRRLADLALAYAGVAEVPRGASPWDGLVLDRTDARWRELVDLARLLLGDRFQTTSAGGGRGFSLLFDMNRLFEAYVAKMLTRALAGGDLRVVVRGERLFCLTRVGEDGAAGGGCFQARPDILVKRGADTLLVIDAKWKRLAPRTDAARLGVAQADIYQMMAYGRLYACPRLMLLYPHPAGLGEEGVQESFRVAGSADLLAVATVDLARLDGMTARLKGLVDGQLGGASAGPLHVGSVAHG